MLQYVGKINLILALSVNSLVTYFSIESVRYKVKIIFQNIKYNEEIIIPMPSIDCPYCLASEIQIQWGRHSVVLAFRVHYHWYFKILSTENVGADTNFILSGDLYFSNMWTKLKLIRCYIYFDFSLYNVAHFDGKWCQQMFEEMLKLIAITKRDIHAKFIKKRLEWI